MTDGACSACGHAFSVSHGIVDFIPEDDFYWGEIDEGLMKRINDQAEEGNWLAALTANLTGKYEHFMDYILNPVRYASIFHFYNEAQAETCLDLGSGWGPISFGLARFFQRVYSVDGVYERLRFQSIRAEQSGIRNLKFLRSSMLHIPVPDNTADVVIVNGLLEWIGLSETNASPEELQVRFLREVRRVLKPGGRLMIGIENRFGLQFLHGNRDHSGLRFTSVMPRKLANLVVKRFKRKYDGFVYSGGEDAYRTLTYSYWGYERLLKKASFQTPEIYWTLPSYNYPHATGTAEGGSVRYYLSNLTGFPDSTFARTAFLAARLVPERLMTPIIKMFSPTFLIIANKEETSGRLQDEFVGSTHKSFLRTSPDASASLFTTYHCLQNGKASRVVSVLEEGNGGGRSRFISRESNGNHVRSIRLNHLPDIHRAAAWLAEFHRASMQEVWSVDDLSRDVESLSIQVQAASPDDLQLRGLLDRFRTQFVNALSATPLPRITEHGDFLPANILVDTSGELKVNGWGHNVPAGNPLMDTGSFYLSLLRSKCKLQEDVFIKTRNMGAGEFFNVYRAQSGIDLPMQLSPAYALLRLISRALKDQALDPHNYLYIKGWLKYLPATINLIQETESIR